MPPAPEIDDDHDDNIERDDDVLIKEAEMHIAEERILVGADLLRQVQDKDLLSAEHHNVIHNADRCQDAIKEILSANPENDGADDTEDAGWTKQSESHGGHRDIIIYYKVNEKNMLTCHIQTVIESSLLVPVMSVLNESELYEEWMPSWKVPFKLGLSESVILNDQSRKRFNQIIQVTVNMPWPMKTRQVIQHAYAIDEIDNPSLNAVIAKAHSLDVGEVQDDITIPEPNKDIKRIDFDVCMMFQPCPADHPCLQKSKVHYPPNEPLILLTIVQNVDAHVSFVPQSFINFTTRTVIGRMVQSLLHVAEEVRDGKRIDHEKAIKTKHELYDWIRKRVDIMLSKM